MAKKKINGFDEKQIMHLYAYLVAYEESGIGKYKSTKAMLKEHPELLEIENFVKIVKCNESNAQEMIGIDFKSLVNEIYHKRSNGNHLLSLLAHLRNSIAHGCAVGHCGKVLITDFVHPKYKRPIDFSARGCIEFDMVKYITKILNKIEL